MNIPEVATTAAIYSLAGLDEMQDFITEDLERFATAALEAALPHIRKQIADDIRQASIDTDELADVIYRVLDPQYGSFNMPTDAAQAVKNWLTGKDQR